MDGWVGDWFYCLRRRGNLDGGRAIVLRLRGGCWCATASSSSLFRLTPLVIRPG